MPRAIITLEDNEGGGIDITTDFGDAVDEASQAHGMASVLLESVLKNAKTFTKLEDTAPEVDVEPSRIITPNSGA